MLDGIAVRGVCQVDVRQSFDSVSTVTLEIAVSDIVQREVPRENKTFVELHLDTTRWDDAAARLERWQREIVLERASILARSLRRQT